MKDKNMKQPEKLIIPLYIFKIYPNAFEICCDICGIDKRETELEIMI